jgi:hypothetical protein
MDENDMTVEGQNLELLPGEDANLKDEILEVIGEQWLYTKNSWFSGRAPIALIGTPEEPVVRDIVRSIKAADFS